MGIRVTCPNGHALHLKAFLAGRRGICPHCGAKFLIPAVAGTAGDLSPGSPHPLEGQSASASPRRDVPSSADPGQQGAAVPTSLSLLEQPLDDLLAAHQPRSTSMPSAPQPASAAVAQAQADSASQSNLRSVPPTAPGPVVWHAQTPDGHRYGPISDEELQRWLREGRLPAAAHVWRAPWTEWKTVSAAFPQAALPPPPQVSRNHHSDRVQLVATDLAEESPAAGPAPPEVSPARSVRSRLVAKGRREQRQLLVVAALTLVVVILAAVLWRTLS